MSRAAIYLRVSTSGQSVDSQRDACNGAASGYSEVEIFEDVISGASASRDGLDAMMAGVRRHRYQVVICYKLDRLGRSLAHLAQLVAEFDRHGVGLVAASQGIDTSRDNPVGRLQLNVLMAVAEFEREIIRDRTKEGLAAARARGVQLGRPKGISRRQQPKHALVRMMLDQVPRPSLSQMSERSGVSKSTICNWMRELKI